MRVRTTFKHRSWRRVAVTSRAIAQQTGALAAVTTLLLTGCQSGGPVFPPLVSPPVWPAPPDRARIVYVGELIGEESLRAEPSGMEILGAVLTGPRPKARFVTPMAVAVAGDRVYVADPSAAPPTVHVLDMAARKYSAIRTAGGSPLEWPIDVAICGDSIAIADAKRAAVFVVDSEGKTIRTIQGNGLMRPAAVTWDPANRELFVLDAGSHAIAVYDEAGQLHRRLGRRGVEDGAFNAPAGICVFSRDGERRVFVADSMNFRAQLLSLDGTPLLRFGKKGDAAGDFSLPRDVAADSDGNLYVLDSQFENVQLFDGEGRLLMSFGKEGSTPGDFYLPSGIAIDSQDRIWVADTYNRRVQVFRYLREEQAQ